MIAMHNEHLELSFRDQNNLYTLFHDMERKSTWVGTATKPKTAYIVSTYSVFVCQAVFLLNESNVRGGHFPGFSDKHLYDLTNCFDSGEFVIVSGYTKDHDKWREVLLDLGYKSKVEYTDDFNGYCKDVIASPEIGIMSLRHRIFGNEIVRLY